MPSSVTVTAKAGPALQATALALTGVTGLLFDIQGAVLKVFQGGDRDTPPAKVFDLVGVTTVTFSISGLNYTVTVS